MFCIQISQSIYPQYYQSAHHSLQHMSFKHPASFSASTFWKNRLKPLDWIPTYHSTHSGFFHEWRKSCICTRIPFTQATLLPLTGAPSQNPSPRIIGLKTIDQGCNPARHFFSGAPLQFSRGRVAGFLTPSVSFLMAVCLCYFASF